jgi:hypothetical protein
MIESGVGRMKGQRDKGLKAPGVILHGAQAQHMVDAVLIVLDVPVQHGCVGTQPKLVGGARCLQPLVAVDLVVADDVAHAIGENLRPAPRQGIHAGLLHLDQRFANGQLGAPREVGYLNHGEGFDVYFGKALFKARHEVEEILKWKVGMQAADDVKLCHCLAVARGSGLPRFFQGHGISPWAIFSAAERA